MRTFNYSSNTVTNFHFGVPAFLRNAEMEVSNDSYLVFSSSLIVFKSSKSSLLNKELRRKLIGVSNLSGWLAAFSPAPFLERPFLPLIFLLLITRSRTAAFAISTFIDSSVAKPKTGDIKIWCSSISFGFPTKGMISTLFASRRSAYNSFSSACCAVSGEWVVAIIWKLGSLVFRKA